MVVVCCCVVVLLCCEERNTTTVSHKFAQIMSNQQSAQLGASLEGLSLAPNQNENLPNPPQHPDRIVNFLTQQMQEMRARMDQMLGEIAVLRNDNERLTAQLNAQQAPQPVVATPVSDNQAPPVNQGPLTFENLTQLGLANRFNNRSTGSGSSVVSNSSGSVISAGGNPRFEATEYECEVQRAGFFIVYRNERTNDYCTVRSNGAIKPLTDYQKRHVRHRHTKEVTNLPHLG